MILCVWCTATDAAVYRHVVRLRDRHYWLNPDRRNSPNHSSSAWLDILEKGRTDILERCVDAACQSIHARDSAECNERNHQGILDEVLSLLVLKQVLAGDVHPMEQVVQFHIPPGNGGTRPERRIATITEPVIT